MHPGEVLFEEFLKPMNLSQNRLAINIGVPMDYDLGVAEDMLSARLNREVRPKVVTVRFRIAGSVNRPLPVIIYRAINANKHLLIL